MIEYDLKKNNNKKNVKAYGKYYAKPHISETVDLDELADHMHGHNSPFSAGTIKGILIDAVTHIKELLLMGKNVKLDNLAIFYISIKNKMGAENADDFTVSKNIEGVRMKARATGDFRSVNLNLDANLKKYGAKKKKSSTTDSGLWGIPPHITAAYPTSAHCPNNSTVSLAVRFCPSSQCRNSAGTAFWTGRA